MKAGEGDGAVMRQADPCLFTGEGHSGVVTEIVFG